MSVAGDPSPTARRDLMSACRALMRNLLLSQEEAVTEAARIGARARVGLFLMGDRFRRLPGFVTAPEAP